MKAMAEGTHVARAVLAATAVVVVAGYVALFRAAGTRTFVRRHRRDSLATKLVRVLDDVSGHASPEGAHHGRQRVGAVQ